MEVRELSAVPQRSSLLPDLFSIWPRVETLRGSHQNFWRAYRTWRGRRYKYLLVDEECFWLDWPALNRAKADTLD